MRMPAIPVGIFIAFSYAVKPAYTILFSICIFATLFGATPARATRTDFPVNDDGAQVEHSQPRISVIPGKGFAIAWSDYRSTNRDIFIQRFGIDGTAIGSNQLVNTDTNSTYQAGPALGIDGSGNYAVVWQDYRDGVYPFGPHVYFQRFDSAVTPVGTNRNLTVEKPDSLKELPDLAIDSWGRGVVVWADYRNRNWDIYGQIIAPNGALIGANFKLNDDNGTAQQHAPRVSRANDGWSVVTWYDSRNGNDDIYAQRIDSLGRKLGANIKVNSDNTGTRQAFPDVAVDGSGHFTVVWTDWRNGTYPANPDIYARRFDSSMAPLTIDTRVNADVSTNAQRDPAISADRLGNVAIVWSDSTATSWDVSGEMIDATGVIRELNFRANTKTDSAQLTPDVALDGRNRYVTWVDKRTGQFNIFAAIATYNNPTLVARPTQLQFSADISSPIPLSQQLIISHAGYNSLHFRIKSSVPWLSASPTTGITTDTIALSITQSLTYGSHYGTLTLVDDDNHDSTVAVPVRLDITAPVLAVTPDTLRIGTFKGVKDTVGTSISIANSGTGQVAWSASSSSSWLTLGSSSGTAPTQLALTLNSTALDTGLYSADVIVQSAGAIGSPDTIPVQFQVVSNRPYLLVTPDSIHLSILDTTEQFHPLLRISNPGIGMINWTAASDQPWISLSQSSGMAGDSIDISLSLSTLTPGRNAGTIVVTDSNAFNIAVTVPVTIDWLTPSSDTLVIGSADCALNDTTSVPLTGRFNAAVATVTVPMIFADTLLTFDSMVVDPALSSHVSILQAFAPGRGTITLTAKTATDSIPSGNTTLGRLYFHSGARAGLAAIEEDSTVGTMAQIRSFTGVWGRPTTLAGQINVGARTGVDDGSSPLLPRFVELSQNYPNPCNGSTIIRFGLPSAADVRLEIFNVLGQSVEIPVNLRLAAGWHQVLWPSTESTGRNLASGIYFYRLTAGSAAIVRKLVLLK